MGMFDYIKCEVLLPDGVFDKKRQYQTKAFDRTMSTYVITTKGELYEEQWDWEWFESNTHWLGGYSEKVEGSYRRRYLTDFHGDVIFYGDSKSGPESVWRDYYARFTDGKLSRIWYKDIY